jgi:hypothetical protein
MLYSFAGLAGTAVRQLAESLRMKEDLDEIDRSSREKD